MEENEITSPFVEDATTPDTGSTQPTAPAPKRKNWFRRHTKLCVAVVILAVVAAVVGSQLRKSKAAAGASADYQYVRTTTLKTTSLNDSVTVNGTVKSGDEASVTVADSAKTYKVATVNVEVGDTVQEGDVIATLDTTDLDAQIKVQQEAVAAVARAVRRAHGLRRPAPVHRQSTHRYPSHRVGVILSPPSVNGIKNPLNFSYIFSAARPFRHA